MDGRNDDKAKTVDQVANIQRPPPSNSVDEDRRTSLSDNRECVTYALILQRSGRSNVEIRVDGRREVLDSRDTSHLYRCLQGRC